jgi:hypothetical protein
MPEMPEVFAVVENPPPLVACACRAMLPATRKFVLVAR